MTPFMHRVQALLEGGRRPAEPQTEPSRPTPVSVAVDSQMVIRSLAEQLVSEANAILREHGELISLDDDCGTDEALAFTMTYRDRQARVQTELTGRTALVRVVLAGESETQPRMLASAAEVQALVLSLVSTDPHR